eukprot:scaffold114947_cov60-Phaeocystis_antarctica.AAC.2
MSLASPVSHSSHAKQSATHPVRVRVRVRVNVRARVRVPSVGAAVYDVRHVPGYVARLVPGGAGAPAQGEAQTCRSGVGALCGIRESRVATGGLEKDHGKEAAVVEEGVEARDRPVSAPWQEESTPRAGEGLRAGVARLGRRLWQDGVAQAAGSADGPWPLLSVAAPQEPPAGEAVHNAVGLAEERPHATPPGGRRVQWPNGPAHCADGRKTESAKLASCYWLRAPCVRAVP